MQRSRKILKIRLNGKSCYKKTWQKKNQSWRTPLQMEAKAVELAEQLQAKISG
jgi:hypothetical protein